MFFVHFKASFARDGENLFSLMKKSTNIIVKADVVVVVAELVLRSPVYWKNY